MAPVPTVVIHTDTRFALAFIHWFAPVAPLVVRLTGPERFERWFTAVALRLIRVRVENA